MSTRCYILNLPIEILDLVYEYLPNMRDKLNFGKAHGVLGNAFAFHAGDVFKYFMIRDEPIQEYLDILPLYGSTVPWTLISTREEWSDILSLCGSSVTGIQYTEVYFTCTPVDVVKLASIYCPNLEELYFPISSSFWKHFKPLLLPLQNLVRIELWNSFEIGLSNSFEYVNLVEILQQLPKLENLKLHDFNRKDLEDVGKLVNLKVLTIDGVATFNTYNLHKFPSIRMPENHAEEQLWPNIELLDISHMDFNPSLPYLPTLKYLSINTTYKSLTDVLGQSAFSYGKTLEKLHFAPKRTGITDADFGIITKLKALKRLEFPFRGDDWMERISRNLENLEVLIVLRDCISSPPHITNRGVMMVINGCKKLRYLQILECHLVISDMVVEAVSALSLRPKENTPLLLSVHSRCFCRVDESKLGGVLDIKYN